MWQVEKPTVFISVSQVNAHAWPDKPVHVNLVVIRKLGVKFSKKWIGFFKPMKKTKRMRINKTVGIKF